MISFLLTLVVKPRSQSGPLKGRSLVWDRMWISSPLAQPNTCNCVAAGHQGKAQKKHISRSLISTQQVRRLFPTRNNRSVSDTACQQVSAFCQLEGGGVHYRMYEPGHHQCNGLYSGGYHPCRDYQYRVKRVQCNGHQCSDLHYSHHQFRLSVQRPSVQQSLV